MRGMNLARVMYELNIALLTVSNAALVILFIIFPNYIVTPVFITVFIVSSALLLIAIYAMPYLRLKLLSGARTEDLLVTAIPSMYMNMGISLAIISTGAFVHSLAVLLNAINHPIAFFNIDLAIVLFFTGMTILAILIIDEAKQKLKHQDLGF